MLCYGKFLILSYDEGEVYAYELSTGTQWYICTNTDYLLGADEKYLYFSSVDNEILRLDISSKKEECILFEDKIMEMQSKDNGKELYVMFEKGGELYMKKSGF